MISEISPCEKTGCMIHRQRYGLSECVWENNEALLKGFQEAPNYNNALNEAVNELVQKTIEKLSESSILNKKKTKIGFGLFNEDLCGFEMRELFQEYLRGQNRTFDPFEPKYLAYNHRFHKVLFPEILTELTKRISNQLLPLFKASLANRLPQFQISILMQQKEVRMEGQRDPEAWMKALRDPNGALLWLFFPFGVSYDYFHLQSYQATVFKINLIRMYV